MLKKKTHEIYIKILVFTGIIAISVFTMGPIHSILTGAMSHFRTNFIEKIESLTGIEIKYSSIRPTLFGSFDIRNLSLNKYKKPFLSVTRVRISFSIFKLLKGNIAAFKSVLLDHPSITLNIQDDKDTFEFLASLKNDEKKNNEEILRQIARFFPGKTDLRIRNCFISITDNARKYQIQNMNIDVTGDGEKLSFNTDLDAEFIYAGLFNRTFSVNCKVSANGVCSVNLDEGNAALVISSIAGSEQETGEKKASFFNPFADKGKETKENFSVLPLNFTLDFKDGIFTLNIEGENLPYNGFIYYNTATKGIATEINCNNFLLGNFVKFSRPHNDLNRIFFMPISGSASFYSAGSAMRYRADFHGEDAQKNSFIITTYGNDKYIAFDKVSLYAPYKKKKDSFFSGELDISGRIGFNPLTSAGTISFNQFSLGTDDFINALFTVSTQDKEIRISGEKIAVAQLTFDNFDIYLVPTDKDFSVTVSCTAEKEKKVDMFAAYNYSSRHLDAGHLDAGNLDSRNLEISTTVVSFSVYDIIQIASPFSKAIINPSVIKNFLTDSSITTDIFITTDFNHVVYNVPNMVFTSQDVLGRFSFSGTDKIFTLNESVITRSGIDLIVGAQYNFANPMDIGFSLNAKFQDLSWNVEGQILDKTTLIIRDKAGLYVYGSMSNSGGVSGYMEGVNFPFLVNNRTIYLNFYISLRYTSSDFWSVDVARFNANDLNASQGISFIGVSGSIDNNGASFRNLMMKDNIGELAGSIDFTWDTDFSYINFLVNLTDGWENGENYTAEGTVKKNHFNIKASASEMRLDRLLRNKKGGNGIGPVYLSGNADISGDSINSFSAKCDLKSLYLKNSALKASGEVVFTNDEFTTTDLILEYRKIKIQMPLIQLNRAECYAKAKGEVQGIVLNKWLESDFELNANFKNIDSWLEITRLAESINGSFKVDKIQYGYTDYDPFSFIIANNNDVVSVSGGPKNMLKMEMNKEGNFFASLSSPFFIQTTVVGNYKDGIIDAHCNDVYLDISGIWEFAADIPEFAITGGYITGKVDIRGPVLDPEFFGNARGTSFRFIAPNYINGDIKLVPFDAVLEGSNIIFGPVATTVGAGGGTASGWLRFENWVPENANIEITIPKNSPIPFKFSTIGIIAKGDASGKVNFIHENKIIEVTANVLANNTEMGLVFDEIMQSRFEKEKPEPKVPAILDFTITTGPMVEFIWPNTSSPILRANPEIGSVISVFADTATGQYSVESDITVKSGEMYYFDRSFYIRQANLVFRENEQKFAPRITARAEIRERMDSGPVTVSMIVNNEPLLSFVPRFEASPSLTQLEIYSLLGHSMYGMSGNEGDNGDNASRVLLSSTTDILSQLFANSELGQIAGVRRFERTIRSWLFLDMFSVRTKILQNVVVSNVGQTQVDKNTSVGNYFDNTTVYLGKYIGQDMFVQSMIRMRYDENNMNMGGFLNMGGLRLEPDIGIEFNTPLFNIRWDFLPESYNPENWGIKDNSITLIWSKSF